MTATPSPPVSPPATTSAPPSLPAAAPSDVFGVVLAGGLGRRMGGADKGLLPWQGTPLARHIADRLAGQVGAVAINANRNTDTYTTFGYPLLPDRLPDFPGPLAGFHAALAASPLPLVMLVPCDSPDFPADLVARLRDALLANDAEVAVARADGRRHSVFCLCRRELAADLAAFLAAGERKVGLWQDGRRLVQVEFTTPEAFRNCNSREDLDPASGPN